MRTWKFVDSPVTVPATLFDMNDRVDCVLEDEGFDISPPELKKSVSKSNMRDGGRLTASSYENRLLSFKVGLQGPTAAAKEQLLVELNQELAKPNNLIMYKADAASVPVFFRTVRSDNYKLVNRGGGRKVWTVDCAVEAESFGIGVRQNLLSSAVITNNPASGTNPGRIDLTGITGDSPSPAFIRLGTNITAATYFVLGQKTINATSLDPFVQAETGTLGTDTTLPGNDVAMSGSGSNYARCTFGTDSNLVTRLTVTAPVTLRGSYRVYARIRCTATANLQMRYGVVSSSDVLGPFVDLSYSASTLDMVDLGVIDFPFAGQPPAEIGYSKLGLTYSSQSLRIMASRSSGTGNLDIDYIYFMPADERLCSFQQTESTGFLCIDGPNETTFGLTSGSDPFGGTRVYQGNTVFPLIGGVPNLVPGVTNRWFMLRGRGSAVTNTTNLWVDYWPRWREVAI